MLSSCYCHVNNVCHVNVILIFIGGKLEAHKYPCLLWQIMVCVGIDDTILPVDKYWLRDHVRDYPHTINLCSNVQRTIAATLDAVSHCKMKEVTRTDVKLISRILKTATTLALGLFRIKEQLSTDDALNRNFGGIKFHALNHHFAEQIMMFGTCLFTDTDQFERQHNIDGVLSYTRSSKRGHSMSKEMLFRSMTTNFLRIIKQRTDEETLHVLQKKRSAEDYETLKRCITGTAMNNNDLEDGFRVLSNYKSVPVLYDRNRQSLVIRNSTVHRMITAEQLQFAFESFVEENGDFDMQQSLRKLQKGTHFLCH